MDLFRIVLPWESGTKATPAVRERLEEIARPGFDRCPGSDRTAQRCLVVSRTSKRDHTNGATESAKALPAADVKCRTKIRSRSYPSLT